jgi:hypothetical protein
MLILDKNHCVISVSLTDSMDFLINPENRRIGLDRIAGVTVSTVFLLSEDSEQMPFETMIFDGSDNELTYRYATYQEAVLGHADAIELVKEEQAREWYDRMREPDCFDYSAE